ncbi:flagellar export protein FliJ [Desulfotomaculum nigrificans CO-1-SRB]|uniref:Flagellar FliJ protein n=1 Tax=Desulfotomaculum nigrificans (strain DSM 14880 / VKM B-2319 / CO-1-SRB) TaxID=868595 RepID=F6B804_DESCC|nr:flagellar export protein FliJ [Desulfotomaculum nigrificans]AEF94641.1 flagellar export protein FliJ [Desulfotomaculum nigrificans CO-1-SRB]
MKKFQFRLEQVLQQRIKREEAALLEQARAEQECDRCQRELAASERKLEEALQAATAFVRPDEQMQSLIYREHLQQVIARQRRLLQRSQEILQLRQAATMKARQERMVLEKLKEKKFREYQELEMYLEQREIDELAALRFGRG